MAAWQYAEQILHVDLAGGRAWTEPTSLDLKQGFVGGAGFVARLLAEGLGGGGGRGRAGGGGVPAVDSGGGGIAGTGDGDKGRAPAVGGRGGRPAGTAGRRVAADGPLRVVMATGPLSGGMAGRLALGAAPNPRGLRGPALSSLGGRMAAALKSAGFDAVVLHGHLEEPGLLVVDHDGVALLPAADLAGRDVPSTESGLLDRVGPGYASLIVGPAAENGVPFATLAHEGHYAGGSGVAAALGATRLKAVLVREPVGISSRCTGCPLACPGKVDPQAEAAGRLGLDAPTTARLAALAEQCAREGIFRPPGELMTEIAYRTGTGRLLAEGEAAVLARLGPAAERCQASLPRPKRARGVGMADLVGTCKRLWRDRPGALLEAALTATRTLLASAV